MIIQRSVSSTLLAAAAASSVAAFGYDSPLSRRQSPLPNDTLTFDWYAVEPADTIKWTPCFESTFQCARLNLPLDYSNPSDLKAQIALQMIPATDKANYQGTILVNPGGPGGAGNEFVLTSRDLLVELFGPTFDILGFDPRGTGATLPLAQCFNSSAQFDAWTLQEVFTVREGDNSIPLARARDQVLGALCGEKLGLDGVFDSATVANDMVHILEQLGQEKLLYYGRSYGTLLGQYFAALYPEKVDRMILDGVADADRWARGTDFFATTVVDGDNVMKEFFNDCAMAGAENCAVWEKTPRAIERRVELILAALKREPVAIPAGPLVITEDVVSNFIFHQLYTPMTGFPTIAAGLRAIETRDPAVLAALAAIAGLGGAPANPSAPPIPPWFLPNQAFPAIACADMPDLEDSLAADIATVRKATTVSRWAGGATFSRLRITCGAWPVRTKNRFTGPFSAKLASPMLLVSSTFDPVCPLSAARAVAARFKGARVLVYATPGHTASLNPTRCAFAAIKAYMTNGTLPAEGTICPADVIPLVGSPGS